MMTFIHRAFSKGQVPAGGKAVVKQQPCRPSDEGEGEGCVTHSVTILTEDSIVGACRGRKEAADWQGTTKFAYGDSERVEYYSKTNGMWLHAHAFAEWHAEASRAMYSVRLRGSQQKRRGIGFELLRPPLQRGEPCEVFSVKDGWWLVARVMGCTAGAVPGYEVNFSQLPGSRPATRMVSGAIVRRRFPVGSRLVVYRDAERGWVEAEALSPSEEDAEEMDNFCSWAPEDGAYPPSREDLDFGGTVEGPTLSTLSQATVAPAGTSAFKGPRKPDGSPLDCWFMVPLRETNSKDRELVPSHLVRLHPELLAELKKKEEEQAGYAEFDERQESGTLTESPLVTKAREPKDEIEVQELTVANRGTFWCR